MQSYVQIENAGMVFNTKKGKFTALTGIDLHIDQGQFVALIGHSGCGKSTLLNLSEFKVFSKILFPAVLPYVLTGVRLSIGVAWLVIVAAEMLTGGVGIGFWVWDEWNNLNVAHIIIAIFVAGIVGLLLEQGLMLLAKRFSYD